MPRGIAVHVYRSAIFGDCTNNGISSKQDFFVLTGPELGIPELVEPGKVPELVLTCAGGRFRAVPREILDRHGAWPMFGGNFVYTSDSRFSEVTNGTPVKIFDRVE